MGTLKQQPGQDKHLLQKLEELERFDDNGVGRYPQQMVQKVASVILSLCDNDLSFQERLAQAIPEEDRQDSQKFFEKVLSVHGSCLESRSTFFSQ